MVREGGGTCKQMVINRTRPEFNGSATSFVEINTDPTSVKELRLACATHNPLAERTHLPALGTLFEPLDITHVAFLLGTLLPASALLS